MTIPTKAEGTAREPMSLVRALVILSEAGASRAKTGHLLYDDAKLKEHSDALAYLLANAKQQSYIEGVRSARMEQADMTTAQETKNDKFSPRLNDATGGSKMATRLCSSCGSKMVLSTPWAFAFDSPPPLLTCEWWCRCGYTEETTKRPRIMDGLKTWQRWEAAQGRNDDN